MAVNILTEVAQDYLLNLGKTMRAYMDDVFNKKTPEVNYYFIFCFWLISYLL
jgi:GH15 family glucan-1,4-alpha-glucosidase